MAAPLTCTDLLAVDRVPGTRSTDSGISFNFTSVAFTSAAGREGAGLCGGAVAGDSVSAEVGVSVVGEDWKLVGIGEVEDRRGSLGPTGETAPPVLDSALTFRSLVVPTTMLLAGRLSNTSSVLSWPAAPGRGGKLERPNSKLGDGGLGGGGGGDWGVTLVNFSSLFFLPRPTPSE